MIASQIIVCFTLFGLLGWLFESTYCSLVEKRWCNRGFLFGPVCPIYGAGAVAAILVFGGPGSAASQLPIWAVFVICAVGASAIEWVTSVAMERLFGAVWWDYSDMPLNLQGRVCVPAAALFGLCGLAVVYVAVPLARQAAAVVPPLAFEVASLVFTALLAADATLTICTLTEVLAAVEGVQAEFDQRMQAAVETVPAQLRSGAERLREEGAERAGRLREGSAEYAERLREVASHLSSRQQHVLHNARRFRTERMGAAAHRLTEALDGLVRGRGQR